MKTNKKASQHLNTAPKKQVYTPPKLKKYGCINKVTKVKSASPDDMALGDTQQ